MLPSSLAQQPLDRESLVKLIPKSVDLYSSQEQANWKTLVDLGDKAYPALVEELLETKDASRALRIMHIFAEGNGNKAVPLQAMRRLVARWKSATSGRGAAMRAWGTYMIGDIGGKGETELLFEMMEDLSADVRIASAEALAKIGDLTTAARLSKWLERHTSGLTPEERLKDHSIPQTEKAIEKLKTHIGQPVPIISRKHK